MNESSVVTGAAGATGALGTATGVLGTATGALGTATGALGTATGALGTATGALGTATGALGSAIEALVRGTVDAGALDTVLGTADGVMGTWARILGTVEGPLEDTGAGALEDTGALGTAVGSNGMLSMGFWGLLPLWPVGMTNLLGAIVLTNGMFARILGTGEGLGEVLGRAVGSSGISSIILGLALGLGLLALWPVGTTNLLGAAGVLTDGLSSGTLLKISGCSDAGKPDFFRI